MKKIPKFVVPITEKGWTIKWSKCINTILRYVCCLNPEFEDRYTYPAKSRRDWSLNEVKILIFFKMFYPVVSKKMTINLKSPGLRCATYPSLIITYLDFPRVQPLFVIGTTNYFFALKMSLIINYDRNRNKLCLWITAAFLGKTKPN